MAAKCSILANQNLLDIAIQEGGTVEAVYDIMLLNACSITVSLTPGSEIKLPKTFSEIDREVAHYFQKKQYKPATGGIIDDASATGDNYVATDYWFENYTE